MLKKVGEQMKMNNNRSREQRTVVTRVVEGEKRGRSEGSRVGIDWRIGSGV